VIVISSDKEKKRTFRDERGAREIVHGAGKDTRREIDAQHAREAEGKVKRDADDPHRYAK
jgi:hypothetical protein